MTTVDGADAPTASGPADGPDQTGPEQNPQAPDETDRARRRRRRAWLGLGVAIVAVTGAGAGVPTWLWLTDGSGDSPSAPTGPLATAAVERRSLTATETWDGTVGNGSSFTVAANAAGTITRVAEQGAAVGPGDVLFRIDERPVTLLTGLVPMYRDLRPGDRGIDVQQLETNLAALGFAGFTVDQEYAASTAAAVQAWQQSLDAPATGAVARGDVVFAPEGGRVDALRSAVGNVVTPGTPILDLAGDERVVTFDADLPDVELFAVGATVTVVLPRGEEVPGSVTDATVTEPAPETGGGMAEDAPADGTEPVVAVEVALGTATDQPPGTPVDVVVTVDERSDVLAVPVNALLARAEGGYGLEVVADDGTATIVAVETGLFADGMVEVSSPDIAEGTVVGVAGR